MRRQVSGVPPLVKVGYKGPRKSRGLHPSGYNDILIFNVKDLSKINPKIDAVRIAHTVGNKKRIDIVTEATKLKMKILNPGKIEDIKKLPKKTETKQKKEPATTTPTTPTPTEKIEKPKKEPAAAAATPTPTERMEKPKKEPKATGAKSKSTGKKGTKS
jgi:large subunit ribosomal protein L32e